MGRYDALSLDGLPSFWMGIMTDIFQMNRISDWLKVRLKREVKCEMPDGPRCLRCRTV